MHDILQEIIFKKKQDLIAQKKVQPLEEIREKAFTNKNKSIFSQAILSPKLKNMAIIAEVKLASPTIASLGSQKEIIERVKLYEKANADAISFITEKHYFKGNTKFISQIKSAVKIPVLQKDFVIDEYQIFEAKHIGSDAILLIARLLSKEQLISLVALCNQLGIEPVVEINNEEDLEKTLATKTKIIAVNARNLEDFTVSIPNACKLLHKVPEAFLKLGFSGIHSVTEVEQYKQSGANGILIGTSLMRAKNIEEFLQSL